MNHWPVGPRIRQDAANRAPNRTFRRQGRRGAADWKSAMASQFDLEQRLLAEERLLSTLVAVLSSRDPSILDELEEVFSNPDFAADEAGRAAAQVWKRVADDLARTRAVVTGAGGFSDEAG